MGRPRRPIRARAKGKDAAGRRYSPEQRKEAALQCLETRHAGKPFAERLRLYRPEDAARRRFAASLRSRRGLEVEDYALMWNEQGGMCPICDKPLGDKPAHVDHSHKTDVIRGILHNYCNYRYLGHVERGGPVRWRNAGRHLGWST